MAFSVSQHGIHFRQAGPGDYENVMKINENIYGGFDYLRYMYHEYLHHPRRGMFVAEIDNKVVSFASSFLVDADQSLVITSARTHPDFQGRGIFQALRRYVAAEVKKVNPSVRRVVGSYTVSKDIRGETDDIEYKRHFLFTRYTPDEPLRCPLAHTTEDTLQVHHLSPGDARALLQKTEIGPLFPNNHVMVSHWLPFRLIEENLDEIVLNNGVHVFVSKGDRTDQIIAISFISCLHTKSGNKCDVSFYGDNIRDLKSHLCEHFAFIKRSICKDKHLYILLNFPREFDKNELRTFLATEFNGVEDKFYSDMMVIFKNQSIDKILSQ